MKQRSRSNSLLALPLFALLGPSDWCQLADPPPPPKPVVVEPEPEPEPPPPPPPAPCPSPYAKDVLDDPTVREALDDAWRKSKEGTEEEHEESFWVIQRRLRNGKEVTYKTEIVPDPPGKVASSGGSNKPRISGGRIVMHVHTHPGGAEHESNDQYANDEASPTDVANQETTGVPSAIRYGTGPDPANTKTFLVPRPNGEVLPLPTELNWKCPDPPPPPQGPPPAPAPEPCGDCARSTGDPHLQTHDGLRFDLQAAGEFVAVAVGDASRLQLRLEPLGGSRKVSVTTAVAMKVGDARVSIRPGLGLFVDGEPASLLPSGHSLSGHSTLVMVGRERTAPTPPTLSLAGGGTIERHGDDYVIDWADGSRLWVQVQERSLDVFFEAAKELEGRTQGLFGVHDHEAANDLTTRDGKVLPAPDFEPLYREFAESWRVRADQSLFDYRAGETTDTFTDRTMPDASLSLDDLDPARRADARARCTSAGIVDPVALDECTLDLAASGDPSFVTSAKVVQTIGRGIAGTAGSGLALGSFRISYTFSQADGTKEDMVVSLEPPREALIRGAMRIVLDASTNTLCTGDETTMQCIVSDESVSLGQVGAFVVHEEPETVQGWLAGKGTSPPERIEEETILGRRAVCKRSDVPGAFSSAICYDHALGVLLRARASASGQVILDIEAQSLGKPLEADFAMPEDVRTITP